MADDTTLVQRNDELLKALSDLLSANADGKDPDAYWEAVEKARDVRDSAAVSAADRFSRWLNAGPALAAAAGCYVGIKVTEAKGSTK